jgi:hypothetical protein
MKVIFILQTALPPELENLQFMIAKQEKRQFTKDHFKMTNTMEQENSSFLMAIHIPVIL